MNREYFELDIGNGKLKYTENDKLKIEKAYMNFKKMEGNKKVNRGV
jgi:hypothetical protein